MNNALIRDINQFVMTRLDAGNIKTGELEKDHNTMLDMLNDVAFELEKVGSTMFGQDKRRIYEKIYDVILNTCCRYQEDGFRKGFVDGLALTNIIGSVGMQQGGQ